LPSRAQPPQNPANTAVFATLAFMIYFTDLCVTKVKIMLLAKIHIWISRLSANLQQIFFVNIFNTPSLIVSLEFSIPITAYSKPLSAFCASDKIWLLGKNNFDTFRPCGFSFLCR
jgi:hypothetical protein